MTMRAQDIQLDRLPKFIGLRADAERVIGDLRVLIVAAGSVGARAALELARTGPARLGLADGKDFANNLQTQAARSLDDVGRPKASTVARWARAVAPATEVVAYDRPIQALSWLLPDDYDIVLASTDNLSAEVAIGERCQRLGKPLVYASLHGDTLTAQIRVFSNRDGEGPCPACSFNRTEWEHLRKEAQFTCAPGADEAYPAGTIPTTSVGSLCSLAADLACLTVLRMALGLGEPPDDRLLEYNGYRHATASSPLVRNPDCPCEHVMLERATVDGPLGRSTLRACALAAGVEGGALEAASFAVDDCTFVWLAICRTCGEVPVNAFVEQRRRHRLRCPSCGRPGAQPHAFYSFEGSIPARSGLLESLDTPLEALGARGMGVVVRIGEYGCLVRGDAETPGAPR